MHNVKVHPQVVSEDPIMHPKEERLKNALEVTLWNHADGLQMCFVGTVLILQRERVFLFGY